MVPETNMKGMSSLWWRRMRSAASPLNWGMEKSHRMTSGAYEVSAFSYSGALSTRMAVQTMPARVMACSASSASWALSSTNSMRNSGMATS